MKCKNCNNLYYLRDEDDVMVGKWCPKKNDSPDLEIERECEHYKCITNADRIRSMTDEELEKMLFEIIDKEEMCNHCVPEKRNEIKCNGKCRNGILRWLQSEVDK